MVIPPEQAAHGKRVLIRGGLLLALLACLLFVPSPSGASAIVVFDTLLLTIFAMLVIGLTGPALRFVALSAFCLTVLLPVLVLTGMVTSQTGDVSAALTQVYQVLTERDRFAALYLVLPSLLVSLAAWQLGRSDFRLRPK
jgi:fluoride ion exporter CrcB/FEX